jgi:hypothetical protein
MSKVNTLFQEMEEREFEEAYHLYLMTAVEPIMSEGEFADYWCDKKQAREDGGQFGAGA